MLLVRNVVFAVAFYANAVFWFLLALCAYVLPSRYFIKFCKGWANSSMWLFTNIIGARIEIRGVENIPQGGALIASKHQSSWETIALLPMLKYPTYIYKKELSYIPLFGWHLKRSRQIPVERGKAEALARLTAQVKTAVEEERQVIIFPEGTRRAISAPPDYKIGIAQLYRSVGMPVIPVALNSGLAWPRRNFLKYPLKVIIEFMPPIPADMAPRAFFNQLQETIETATDKLVAEVEQSSPYHRDKRVVTQSSNGS